MVGARDKVDFGTDMVQYGTAVRVPLRGLSSGVKRRIWRDRQIQTQAYNWGVEYALRAHYRGERIPSPRNHSAPLTQFRHETGSTHSLLLQRGGFWGAVDAVKKWSKRRNQMVYAQRKATEGTDKALGVQGAFLDGFASESPDCGGAAMSVQVRAMRESLAQHRGDRRRRIELVESGADSALHLWPTQPSPALSGMPADERAEMIAKATEGSDKALESFNAALKALRAAINSVDCTKAERKRLRGLADKARSAAAAEAKADKRLLAHVDKADKRLFRTRSDTERCSGPALVLFEGCTIRDGGVLRLPGGTEIPLPDGIETIDDVLAAHQGENLAWGGAVHIVDVTDTAGKVTRRTTPEHRKYHAHFLCRASAPAPKPPTSPEHSLGTDWGVVVPLVCSDGSAYAKHASPEQQQASRKRHAEAKRLQQSMDTKTDGRRHSKQRQQRQKLLTKNTDVRVNHQRHVAKAVVTTPEVRQVVLEDTKVSNMTASAEGTKAFPVRGSSAKRGLNRSIAETAPARQAALIERAAVIHSVSTVRVNPAYTSLTCFVCGERGQRETQALFRCPECNMYTHADVQASLNTNEAGNPGLYPSARDVTYGGRDSRHKTLEHALGVFLDTVDVDGSVTNKYARAATCGHSGI